MWSKSNLNARTVRLNPGTTKNDAGQTVALDGELLEAIQAQWEKRRVITIPGESLTCSALRVPPQREAHQRLL